MCLFTTRGAHSWRCRSHSGKPLSSPVSFARWSRNNDPCRRLRKIVENVVLISQPYGTPSFVCFFFWGESFSPMQVITPYPGRNFCKFRNMGFCVLGVVERRKLNNLVLSVLPPLLRYHKCETTFECSRYNNKPLNDILRWTIRIVRFYC